jgi:hypothetical protein
MHDTLIMETNNTTCHCGDKATTTINVGRATHNTCFACKKEFERDYNADGSFKTDSIPFDGDFESSIFAAQEENY